MFTTRKRHSNSVKKQDIKFKFATIFFNIFYIIVGFRVAGHIYIYINSNIYIYRERERERKSPLTSKGGSLRYIPEKSTSQLVYVGLAKACPNNLPA